MRTNDVNVMTKMFTNFFLCSSNKHASYKSVKQRKKKHKIKLSQECLNLMKKRDFLAKTIRKSASVSSESFKQYITLRNKITSMTQRERKEGIASAIDSDPSSRNNWKIINENISNNQNSTQVKIQEKGKEIDSNLETAEIFNCHFRDKIKGLRDRIDDSYKRNPFQMIEQKMNGKQNISFQFKTVSEETVLKTIQNIKGKHSCGYDEISSDLLKKCAHIIYIPLSSIVNTSIVSDLFPEDWKLAIVKPLFKKGKKCDKANYRPISLLSAPSMILERVVRFQIVKYMEENQLFGKNQFGFRSNKSTVGALLSIYSSCMKLQNQNQSTAIALYDLSAAFDCLDVGILCGKLERFGFDQRSVAWISSYLTGRKQKVMAGDSISAAIDLPFGSPQGSCLSPCLFIILISDIELWVQHSKLVGYCDDTSGLTSGKTVNEAVQLL